MVSYCISLKNRFSLYIFNTLRYKQRDGIRHIRSAQVIPVKKPAKVHHPTFMYDLWEPLSEEEFPR
jgi:hypothetical protein